MPLDVLLQGLMSCLQVTPTTFPVAASATQISSPASAGAQGLLPIVAIRQGRLGALTTTGPNLPSPGVLSTPSRRGSPCRGSRVHRNQSSSPSQMRGPRQRLRCSAHAHAPGATVRNDS